MRSSAWIWVFTTQETDTAALALALEQSLADILGGRARVVVLSRDELARVVADNPYADEPNPRAVHTIFLGEDPGPELAEEVAAAERQAARKGGRDAARVVGRAIFLHTPDGYGRSELAAVLARGGSGRSAAATGTVRNWATVTKLLSMCDADRAPAAGGKPGLTGVPSCAADTVGTARFTTNHAEELSHAGRSRARGWR